MKFESCRAFFRNDCNRSNNTGERMLRIFHFSYDTKQKIQSCFSVKTSRIWLFMRDVAMNVIA